MQQALLLGEAQTGGSGPGACQSGQSNSSKLIVILDLIYFYVLIFFPSEQWYKLDELFEQERNVRTAMTNRAGLLALMLHQTIQHDPLTTDLRSNKDR